MSKILLAVALVGLVFFGVRLVTDPADWVSPAIGIAACLAVVWRQARFARVARRVAATPSLRAIHDAATLDTVLASERALLYKHSPTCAASVAAIDEVRRFGDTDRRWRIHVVDVIAHRDLSDAVATRLGVPHESPQLFAIRDGRCVWHAAHGAITSQALGRRLG